MLAYWKNKISKLLIVILIASLSLGMATVPTVSGDQYYKIPLKIQVLAGVEIPKESIEENINDANDIFEDCRIRFNIGKINRDVAGHFDDRGNRTDVINKGRRELTKPPFHGRGGVISIGTSLDMNANINGLTNPNDTASVTLRNDTDGETWAHELGHSLGLSHNGNDKDGDGDWDEFDPDLDGTHDTASDKANLLWPFKNQRTGHELNEEQCEKMRKKAEEVGIFVKDASQAAHAPGDHAMVAMVANYFVDLIGDTEYTNGDLAWATVTAIEPFDKITILWNLANLYPRMSTINQTLGIAIDTDADPTTGRSAGWWYGIDMSIELILDGEFPFTGSTSIIKNDYNLGTTTMIEGVVEIGTYVVDASSYTSVENVTETPSSDWVKLTISMSELGEIAPAVPVEIYTWDNDLFVWDDINVVMQTTPVERPTITVSSLTVGAGSSVEVWGKNYRAFTDVDLIFDDTVLKTITTNENGRYNTSVVIPERVPDTYYFEARDMDGNIAFLVLDVVEDLNQTISTVTITKTPVNETITIRDTTHETVTTVSTVSDSPVPFISSVFLSSLILLVILYKTKNNSSRVLK